MTAHDDLSACHMALRCDDILAMIFETLQPMEDHLPDRATCVNCALVCRWFYEPAGRALSLERTPRPVSPLEDTPASASRIGETTLQRSHYTGDLLLLSEWLGLLYERYWSRVVPELIYLPGVDPGGEAFPQPAVVGTFHTVCISSTRVQVHNSANHRPRASMPCARWP